MQQMAELSQNAPGVIKLRILPLVALVPFVTIACHVGQPAPPAPRPAELEIASSPGDVLRSAADLLEKKGWRVLPFDTSAGYLQAEHRAQGEGNGDWMVCENGVGRHGDTRRATKELISTVAVRVQTSPARTGSLVSIHVTVPTAYSVFVYPEHGPPEYARPRCVSSGAIETQLETALRNQLPS
jgi:hypothetical protein